MSGYKRVAKEIKDQALERVKSGVPVSQVASEFGVSANSVYNWISGGAGISPGTLQTARLKREKDDLLKLVGELTLKLKKGEKNKDGF